MKKEDDIFDVGMVLASIVLTVACNRHLPGILFEDYSRQEGPLQRFNDVQLARLALSEKGMRYGKGEKDG
jgi:hypothetical protein